MELFNSALIPDQQVLQQSGSRQGAAPSAPNEDYFGIPKSPEGLQYTDQLAKSSADLFKKRQDLVNYAKNLWMRDKIDVTNPDPYNPNAVMAAEVFKMELANFLSSADKAKEGQKAYMQMLPRYMDNTFTPGQDIGNTYASELTPEQLGYSKNVDPVLKFAQDNINKTVDNKADFQARQGMAQNMRGVYAGAEGPQGAIQQQAAASLRPSMDTPVPKEPKEDNKENVSNYVDRLINHKAGGGNWDVSKTYTKGGEVWNESTDYKGTRFGKRTVKKGDKEVDLEAVVEKTVRNPATGETFFVFTNADIPPQRIDNVSSNQLLETVSSNNAKYPSVDKVYGYLKSHQGVFDDQGNIVDDVFVRPSTRTKASQLDQQSAAMTSNYGDVKSQIDAGQQSSLFGFGIPFTGSSQEFQSPTFGKIEVRKKANGKYEIKTAKETKEIDEVLLPRTLGEMGIYQVSGGAPSTSQTAQFVNKGGKKAY